MNGFKCLAKKCGLYFVGNQSWKTTQSESWFKEDLLGRSKKDVFEGRETGDRSQILSYLDSPFIHPFTHSNIH